MEWLQKLYIFVLSPFCRITDRIDEKKRTAVAAAVMFLLYGSLLVWYSVNMFDIYISLTSRMVLAAIFLAVFIIFICHDGIHVVSWNRWFAVCWILCGLLIFFMGFVARQNMGYWMIGPVMAFGLPCLYLAIHNSKDIDRTFALIGKAVIAASVIYFIFAVFAEAVSDNVWDISSGRYNGTTSDANRIGEICVASFACGIYLFRSRYSNIFWKAMSLLTMSFCVCDAMISISRSTMIAIACMILYYLIIEIKDMVFRKGIKRALVNILCIVASIVIGFVFISGMREVHKYMEVQKAVQNITAEQEIKTEKKIAEKTVAVETEQVKENKRLETEGKDLNTYSSGRIKIWKEYGYNIKILGHPADGKTPISGNLTNVAAHNTLLEISYRSGALAGILFLITEIWAGIYILRVLFRKENKDYDYFAVFGFIGYIIVSNLQVAYNPLTSIIFFVYILGLSILFQRREKTH